MAMRAQSFARSANSVFMLCDIQTRFFDLIHRMPTVVATADLLLRCSRIIDVPVIVTEQYPKALGNTLPTLPLTPAADETAPAGTLKVYEKNLFSMVTPEVQADLDAWGRRDIVLFGIEAHVCVLQTCLDLRAQDFNVYVVADGVSSQRSYDRKFALRRMENAGATITTAESIIFEMMRGSTHPKFRDISKLFIAHNAKGTSNLFEDGSA